MEKLELEKYLPKEILDGLPVVNYKKGSDILTFEEKKIVYIIEGEARAIRYERGRMVIFPLLFGREDFWGACNKYAFDSMNWDLQALTDVKVIIFSESDSEKHIFSRLEVFKCYMNKFTKAAERGIRGFYIQSRGGAKSHFAYLLKSFSEAGEVSYKKYLHFSYMLGVSESMLYRITREFIEKKIIEKKKNRIIIIGEEKLMECYGEYMYL